MRKKILIGVFLAAALSVVAGEQLLKRGDAQDAKKDVPPPPKPAETPTFPPLPSSQPNLTIPPPTVPLSTPPATKPAEVKTPPPIVTTPTPPPVPQTLPPPVEPTKPEPNVVPANAFRELMKDKDTVVKPAAPVKSPPPVESTKAPTEPNSYTVPPVDFAGPLSNSPFMTGGFGSGPRSRPIAQEVAKIKNCPWSLQVDMVEGQTTVIATVNKKHEFKIVCKSLDLQTAKGMLKASGKVTISGDAFNGVCDQLSIPLTDDRIVLEGAAAVTIQKLASTVSNAPPAAFELKGETLNLRISELQREPFQQTSMRRAIDDNVKQATATVPTADRKWTPYGTLRRVNRKLGNDNGVWQLEDRNGKVLATVLARVGGTLTQHEGQTISVIGSYEVIDGQRYLRVTHIALP